MFPKLNPPTKPQEEVKKAVEYVVDNQRSTFSGNMLQGSQVCPKYVDKAVNLFEIFEVYASAVGRCVPWSLSLVMVLVAGEALCLLTWVCWVS